MIWFFYVFLMAAFAVSHNYSDVMDPTRCFRTMLMLVASPAKNEKMNGGLHIIWVLNKVRL